MSMSQHTAETGAGLVAKAAPPVSVSLASVAGREKPERGERTKKNKEKKKAK